MCGGWVEKFEVSVVVVDLSRDKSWGGRVPGAMSTLRGGAFSLFVDWVEVVLRWLSESAFEGG